MYVSEHHTFSNVLITKLDEQTPFKKLRENHPSFSRQTWFLHLQQIPAAKKNFSYFFRYFL